MGALTRNSKFNEAARARYLEALAETGRHASAALACGIVPRTAQRYRDANPSYEDECEQHIQLYHGWIYNLARARMAEGSDRLIELELKKIDPSYRDKPLIDVNLNGGGGVIMGVPAKSPEQITLDLKANNETRVDPTTDPDMEILLNET